MAPLIETNRLRLRAIREADLDAHAAMLGDPEVMRYLASSATPLSREDAWRKLLLGPGLWAVLGYGYWTVERREDGAVLGQMGFADFKREMMPSIENIPEMGWIFAPHAHGQGYAGEAAEAGLRWADAALPGREIVAIIDPDNAASIRLAEKAGFGECEEAVYKEETILLFRRPPVLPATPAAASAASAGRTAA